MLGGDDVRPGGMAPAARPVHRVSAHTRVDGASLMSPPSRCPIGRQQDDVYAP